MSHGLPRESHEGSDASGRLTDRVEAERNAVILEVSGEERKALRGVGQPAIQRPDTGAAERGRDEEVKIDPADTRSFEPVALDEFDRFPVRRDSDLRQLGEEAKDLGASPNSPKRQLADDERVDENEPILEEPAETPIPTPQVVDPDGRIDERQPAVLRPDGRRRLRGSRRLFSVPPSAARRRALSRAMSAASPAWTVAVFSLRPVRPWAFSRRASSRISVVLICISMALR